MTTILVAKSCTPCRGGIPPLASNENDLAAAAKIDGP